MFPVALRGPRIVLRELVPDDLEGVLAYGSDPEVMRYFMGRTCDRDEEVAFLNRVMAQAQEPDRENYTLAIDLERRLIGTARLGITDPENRSGDLGYALQRAHWGNGYATEATSLLIGFGFEHLGLHRIWATCDPRNVASSRVLEKAGMQLEGKLQHNIHRPDGWRDSLLYAVVARD
jgi:ribosomal-protein-alanine N-acetyltransferase